MANYLINKHNHENNSENKQIPKSNKTIKAQERSHSSDESKLRYPSTRKIGLVLHREKRKIKI